MKTLQAYLAGTLLLAGTFCFSTANAQEDTTRQRRDTSMTNARWSDNTAYTYIDLNSGDTLDYWYDTDKKIVMNRTKNLPVDFYVNATTGDTVYGKGRFVVHGLLLRGEDGKWKFDESKVKIDGDELKIKDGNRKLKIDGDEIKIKENGRKVKSDDGELKIKDGKTKAKVDKDEMKVKDEKGKAKYEKDKTKIKEGDTKIKRKGDSTRIENQ